MNKGTVVSDLLFSVMTGIIALFLLIMAVVILIRKWKELTVTMKIILCIAILFLTVYLLLIIQWGILTFIPIHR